MLQNGGHRLILAIIGDEFLITAIGFRGLFFCFLEAEAVFFLEQDKKFLHIPFLGAHGSASDRVCTAGTRSICIMGATLFRNKHATCPAVINHRQVEARKDVGFFLFHDDIPVQKSLGCEIECIFQAKNVVGGEGEFKLPAAVGEALHRRVAGKGKGVIGLDTFDVFGEKG